jgi:predicted RNase H-like HicB family nuclease
MKTYTYTILIHPADSDETGFWAEVPALPGCFTQGETIEECLQRAPEAIAGYVESLADLHQPIPEEPRRDDGVVGTISIKLPVLA